MGLDWETLRIRLLTAIRTNRAATELADLKQRYPPLERFPNPEKVAEFIANPANRFAEKDAVFRALVRALSATDRKFQTAAPLLWLGLWPGLSMLYYRERRSSGAPPDRVISLIAASLSDAIAQLDLRKVRRPIATLILNTRRGLEERKRKSRLDAEPLVSALVESLQARGMLVLWPGDPSTLDLPAGLANEQAVWILRLWLVEMVGRDADLVVAVVIEERPQTELARQLGIEPASARARLHRAMGRIRRNLKNPKNSMQRFAESPAYSLQGVMKTIPLPATPCPNHPRRAPTPVATVQLGARLYCGPCSERLTAVIPAGRPSVKPQHLFGTACWVVGDLAPGAICPRCLHDAFSLEEEP